MYLAYDPTLMTLPQKATFFLKEENKKEKGITAWLMCSS
jgi:hypothetical protein